MAGRRVGLRVTSTCCTVLCRARHLDVLRHRSSVLSHCYSITRGHCGTNRTERLRFLATRHLHGRGRLRVMGIGDRTRGGRLRLVTLLGASRPILPTRSCLVTLRSPIDKAFGCRRATSTRCRRSHLGTLSGRIGYTGTNCTPSLSLALHARTLVSD